MRQGTFTPGIPEKTGDRKAFCSGDEGNSHSSAEIYHAPWCSGFSAGKILIKETLIIPQENWYISIDPGDPALGGLGPLSSRQEKSA